jgi:hypothetical protein
MGDSVKKYMESLEKKINSGGHFSANAIELEKVMSSREISDAKSGKSVPHLNSTPIEVFEHEYPDLSGEFKQIQKEMYEMFARKHMDYGLNNIALGGDLTQPADKTFSLTGLCIRLTDKISRLKNLLINGKSFVEGEGIQDTFIDIANYGIIGLLVGRDKWKK